MDFSLLGRNKSINLIRKKIFCITLSLALIFLIFGVISFEMNSSKKSKILLETKEAKKPTILTFGDSISWADRNDHKGFVGDLGLPYTNIGINGATLSTKNTEKVNIPTQLLNYYNKTKGEIPPDFLICNGGVNDYYHVAPMGNLPIVAAKTDEEAEKLDKNTILGALEYLFYNMRKLYPKSYRFFVLCHKQTFKAYKGNSTFVDWSITKNPEGYTQTEMYEYFKIVCQLYNVVPIDVFNEGIMNSAFSEYVSPIPFKNDSSVTYKYHIDSDQEHPLDYGYRVGYIPLVLKAIEPYLYLYSS